MANIKCSGKIECQELYIQGQKLSDFIYPIDTVVVRNKNISPASKFGGTWEALPENYCLWTTNVLCEIDDEREGVAPAGDNWRKIPAGLPNIIGKFSAKTYSDADAPSGCFERIWTDSKVTPSGTNKDTNNKISFNANRGATITGIYGNSDTVQPRAYRIYAWKRIS